MKNCLIILTLIIGSQALCRKGFASNVDKITKNMLVHGRDNDNRTVKDIKFIPLERKQHRIICDGCEIVMNYVVRYRKSGASYSQMFNFLTNLCIKFMEWSNIYCHERIQHEMDAILYIIDNGKNITAKRICSFLFVHMNCTDPDAEKWEIPLSPYISLKHSAKLPDDTYWAGIFSDLHFDQEYHAEKNAMCEEPICCHHDIPNNITDGAGYWADNRNCDLPWRTVVELLHSIPSGTINYAYYFCGDVFTQADWRSSKKRVTATLTLFYTLVNNIKWNIKERFYPSLGEHDTHPANLWSPLYVNETHLSTQWLFDLVAELWNPILKGSIDALDTIKKGGFYSIKHKEGLQVIVLNNNVCLNLNLWLIYDDVDPYGQLQWLVEQLDKIQKINSKVYIVQHVPIGSVHCSRQWSEQFARILHRYIFVVVAIFYGHEHHPNVKFLVHPSDIYQMLQGFSGGSLLADGFTNPSYMAMNSRTASLAIGNGLIKFVDIVKANKELWKRPVVKESKYFNSWFNKIYFDKIGRNHNMRYRLKNMFHDYDDTFYNFYVSYFENPPECDFRCRKVKSCSTWVMTTDEAIRCRYYP